MIDATEARAAMIDNKIIKSQKVVRLIIWLTVPVIIITLGLAWIYYAESYEFVNEYISALGNIRSFDLDNINTTSRIIMTTGFSILSFMNLMIAIFYFIRPVLRYNKLKGCLYVLVSIGTALVTIPGDHPTLSLYHVIGAFLFVFSFAIVNFVQQLLRFTRKHDLKFEKKPAGFYFDVLIVVVVFSLVILVGILFILDKTIGLTGLVLTVPLWQKIMVLSELIAIFVLDLEDI